MAIQHVTLMMSDDWMDFALCRGAPIDLFFCDEDDRRSVREAKKICGKCPVIEPCRELSRSYRYGVWAGTTPSERVSMMVRGAWDDE